MKRGFSTLIIICVAFSVGYFSRSVCVDGREVVTVTHIKVDTLRDTIPVPKEVHVLRVDTIPVLLSSDTVRDTILVPIPIERKTYFKEGMYRAVIEGYKPELISIETFSKTITNDNYIQQNTKRWGIGLHAGYGLGVSGVTPYVGIGINYNIIQW